MFGAFPFGAGYFGQAPTSVTPAGSGPAWLAFTGQMFMDAVMDGEQMRLGGAMNAEGFAVADAAVDSFDDASADGDTFQIPNVTAERYQ